MSSKAVDGLRLELDRVRQSLRDTDDNIRRLTGRESVTENRFRPRDNFYVPPAKRQNVGGINSWLPKGNRLQGNNYVHPDSGDEDEMSNKPAIQSSIVAAQKDSKSRQDIIERQNSSEKDKARNRRMFGVLMGTLQQFRAEEKQKEQQEQKRKAVEQKLEEKQKEEKELLKKEKQQLFVDRREKQVKMKLLENKIELVQLHEEWEEQTRTLMNFIRSNSKPHIFYLPKSHTDASLKNYEHSKAALEGIISERKRQLDDEIEDGIKQPENKQIAERKTGVRNYYGKSQRNRVDNEDGEKMDVSDLEDDTGVNVDYGASGDEQSYAMKEAHQTANKKSHTPSSHHKDKGKLRQHGHHHSSKAKEKKVIHRDKQSRKPEELHRRDKDSEIVSKETDKCSQDYDHNDNASIVHLDGIADNSIAQGRKMDEKLDELKEMSLDVEQQNQLVDNDVNAK